MRRIAAALAAVVAGAASAPGAAAQTPIAGAGSFNDAPLLAPGSYADTLRGGEQLFYAVRLEPGRRLGASATIAGRTRTSYFMAVRLYTPRREEAGEGSQSFGPQDRSVSLTARAEPAAEGGIAYVAVAAREAGARDQPDQFDTRVELRVTGTAATPTPTPTPSPTASAAPRDEPDGGPGTPVAAIGLGLVLGLLGGFGGRRALGRPR